MVAEKPATFACGTGGVARAIRSDGIDLRGIARRKVGCPSAGRSDEARRRTSGSVRRWVWEGGMQTIFTRAKLAVYWVDRLKIAALQRKARIVEPSGGNQQKVVKAK